MFTAYLTKLGLNLLAIAKDNFLLVACLLVLVFVVLFAKCSKAPEPPKPLDLSAVEAVVDAKVKASEARLEAKLNALDAKLADADEKVKKARRAIR